LVADSINGRRNQRRIAQLELTHVESSGTFGPLCGARVLYVVFNMGITSWLNPLFASETTKATLWVALDPMVMRLPG
jgi:hypothetical protein